MSQRALRARPRSPILLLILLVALAGCYRTPQSRSLIMQRAVNARELYREPGFGIRQLESEGLTNLAVRLGLGRETFGQVLGQALVETLQRRLEGGLVHPNLASSKINEAGLTDEYAAMLEIYDKTNILERDVLAQLSDVIGVRYFAVPILVNFNESLSTRLSLLGLRIGKTASANARFQLQLWDGQSGRIVWEGISDLTLAQETFREDLIPFEDTIQATWQSLIEKIPTGTEDF